MAAKDRNIGSNEAMTLKSGLIMIVTRITKRLYM